MEAIYLLTANENPMTTNSGEKFDTLNEARKAWKACHNWRQRVYKCAVDGSTILWAQDMTELRPRRKA